MLNLAEKKESTVQAKIYRFPADTLINYLSNYNISKEVFNFSGKYSDSDNELLKEFYETNKEKAERLVIEGEFVGITFNNLDRIESKLVKKM